MTEQSKMKASWFCGVVLLFLLSRLRDGDGGNILIWPFDGSHWINMNIMIKALHSRGHNITVIRSSKSWYIQESSPYYKTITVPVEGETDFQEFALNVANSIVKHERESAPLVTFLHTNVWLFSTLLQHYKDVCTLVSNILNNAELISSLKASKFELMLTDPQGGGGVILAKYLNLPLVFNVRQIITLDGHLLVAPSPVSYIPSLGTGYTDKMTFLHRVNNVLKHIIAQAQYTLFVMLTYQPLCEKHFGPSVNFNNLVLEADIWLMRLDFVFEFPRPTMPNVVYVGGFQCKPANPLPPHLEDFVQSSGEHGVILMSMGTFVKALPVDVTDEIAAAFAKLSQKVIWKHSGPRPAMLGNNTLLVDRMPQNDLLGHPKIRLFVAHGGTNGLQEAIYHGVPVLGVPLFFDQNDNLQRLKEKGGAKIRTLSTVDKDSFLSDVEEVLSDQKYKKNMQRLSRLHRDQPIKPMDSAIFWIEFVMRHKGAAHLRTESYKMPWYSYYSVDVLLFLCGVFLLVLTAFCAAFRFICKVCSLKSKRKLD